MYYVPLNIYSEFSSFREYKNKVKKYCLNNIEHDSLYGDLYKCNNIIKYCYMKRKYVNEIMSIMRNIINNKNKFNIFISNYLEPDISKIVCDYTGHLEFLFYHEIKIINRQKLKFLIFIMIFYMIVIFIIIYSVEQFKL